MPDCHLDLGRLVAVDGSLIDTTLSMEGADYRKKATKATTDIGFDLNRGIPGKIFFTNGKGAERPFVAQVLSPEETGVIDHGYQSHDMFDLCRKKAHSLCAASSTKISKTVIEARPVVPGSIVFYDAVVLLGTAGINQTKKPLRLVGYEVDSLRYWLAPNRYDLSAERVAATYKLSWDVENFFGWWNRHLTVYHLIARNRHGLMVQILAGLTTYLLFAIYRHEHYRGKVSIKRIREL